MFEAKISQSVEWPLEYKIHFWSGYGKNQSSEQCNEKSIND